MDEIKTTGDRYGLLAVSYAKKLIETKQQPSSKGWEAEASKIFLSDSLIKKSCLKNCFLGICEEGLINNIPKGKYTTSRKNKNYGIAAIEILSKNDEHKNQPLQLWEEIPGHPNTYNHQMHVVCALWNAGMIHTDNTYL